MYIEVCEEEARELVDFHFREALRLEINSRSANNPGQRERAINDARWHKSQANMFREQLSEVI